MNEILARIVANELRDFAGARLKGHVVLHDELVNEVLTLGLAELKHTTTALTKPAEATQAEEASVDWQKLLRAVKIEQLDFRTEKGSAIVDLSVEIPG